MLYHALAEPHSGVDVEQVVCTMRGAVDAAALRAAWEKVFARHPALRTAFDVGAALTQAVAESCELPFAEQDFSALPAEEREERWTAELREDRRRGFDLNVAPLLRVSLFEFGPDEHRMLWTFHHAILDGRALTTVLREVFAILDGTDLPPTPRPFHEHAAWLSGRDPAASESYWKAQLAGFLAPTPVVVDHLAPGDTAALQADSDLHLAPTVAAALRDLAAAGEFTLNNIVQGAWSLLLSRYSGEADIVFGATRACRHASVAGSEAGW